MIKQKDVRGRENAVISPYRRQLVKTGEEFVECHDELLSGALRGQAGETLDVCEQNTETNTKGTSINLCPPSLVFSVGRGGSPALLRY